MSPQDKVTVMDALEELRYSSTTTTSSRKYFAAKAVLSLDTDTVHDDAVSREKFEAVAKIVYDQWVDKEGWKPWVDEGNSFKQDNARKVASQIYAVICSEPRKTVECAMSEVLTDKEITMLWLNIHGHLAPPTDTKQAFARLIVAATLQKLNAHFDEWWSHSYTRALRAGLPKAPKN